ncbi:MAG: hypothetical protein HUK08_08475 [Bacteroidaceae bacterium]|nr:hypothetical protein [Bacteroidaceae bacterium]
MRNIKREYSKPQCVIYNVRTESLILAGSPSGQISVDVAPSSEGSVSPGDAL